MKRVMVFGTFDILHPGHIEFLRKAKKLGTHLIVSLARDNNILKIKGRRAVHTETDRKKLLKAVKFVDRVVLGSKTDYLKHILKYKPQVIGLGYDQKAYTNQLEKKLKDKGLTVRAVRLKAYKPGKYKTRKLWR